MDIKSFFKTIIKSLSVVERIRIRRQEWVKSLTLPMYKGELHKLSDIPTSIHLYIDPYLTFKERADLLEKFGWIRRVTIDGENLCYIPRDRRIIQLAIHNHLSNPDNLKGISEDFRNVLVYDGAY